MIFEDGSDTTLAARQLLLSNKDHLNCPHLELLGLPQFLERAQAVRLTRHEKETLVEQATILIDQFYAHLPFKRARYATDPVQRFRLLLAQLDHHPNDRTFHDQMIQAFLRLRDAHTYYGLPAPYRGSFAFLPFRMDCFGEPRHRKFLVTNVLDGFDHPRFGVGAEIILWQGMPLELAIEREADRGFGCNRAARFVRGMKQMTKRDLTLALPPDEYSVVLQYIPYKDGPSKGSPEQFCIALPWSVAMAFLPEIQRVTSRSSLNQSLAELKQLSQILFHRQMMAPAAQANPDAVSRFPQVFDFQYTGGLRQPNGINPQDLRDPANPDKKFGYLRIKTFELDPADENADAFVEEFKRILEQMQQKAPHGLILDVRSNPGGVIAAAERILQLMTPVKIEPARFHFINSQFTRQIAYSMKDAESNVLTEGQKEWHPWVMDLLSSVTSGDFVTAGRTLTDPNLANGEVRCYQGPVTLLIDASCYSATDIFAAGFQDHGIGSIIGVDENTGGGGANRWTHAELLEKLQGVAPHVPLRKLPRDAQIGVAIRRSSRVGRYAGSFLEDEGVKREFAHIATRNDILNNDQDLLAFACSKLGAEPIRSLTIVKAEILEDDGVSLIVETFNLFRIDCFVDGFQQCSFAVHDGVNVFWVPTGGLPFLPPSQIRVESYAKITDELVGVELKLVGNATFKFVSSTAVAAP